MSQGVQSQENNQNECRQATAIQELRNEERVLENQMKIKKKICT